MSDIFKPHLPELLAPAGNMERLESALRYGANAVYLGGKDQLNLRQGALGFTWAELAEALGKIRAAGAKLYYCLNAFPRQQAFEGVEKSLELLAELGVDGLIVADAGVLRKARQLAPDIEIHLSTQANTASGEAALFWHEQGVSRVNLARELDLQELHRVTDFLGQHAPQLETEVFVHGAMCLAISGQCLLSAWLNQRPGNLGQCTHPCRFEYRGTEMELSALRVEESLREGETLWEIAPEENGFSAFWSPHELCLIKYLAWFKARKISALKLEGRMRTAPVVGHMVNVYRTALDDLAAGNFRPGLYLRELAPLASRPLSSGFFLPCGRRKVFFEPNKNLPAPVIVARLLRRVEKASGGDACAGQGAAFAVQIKAPWSAQDPAQLLLPGLNHMALPVGSYVFVNHRGEKVDKLHPGTEAVVYFEEELPAAAAGLYLRAVV